MATIKAPNAEYNGQIGDVVFKDGVAETDDKAVIAYCRGAGYEVDGTTDNPAALPRYQGNSSNTHTQLGAQLRDAAVDPDEADFLPPVNAGQGDPHGPQVVSPEIHASPGPTPIVPGLVGDPATQQLRETTAAERVLVGQEQVGDVVQDLAKDEPEQAAPEQPPGNATQEAWADWVLATHPDLNETEVRAAKRDDLRDQYGS